MIHNSEVNERPERRGFKGESEGAGDQVIENEAGRRTAAGGSMSMSGGVRWGRAAGRRRLKCKKGRQRREREKRMTAARGKAARGVISGPRDQWEMTELSSPSLPSYTDSVRAYKESRNPSWCQERKLPPIDTDDVAWKWNVWNGKRIACSLAQSRAFHLKLAAFSLALWFVAWRVRCFVLLCTSHLEFPLG